MSQFHHSYLFILKKEMQQQSSLEQKNKNDVTTRRMKKVKRKIYRKIRNQN
jgi:hypothetical protein